MGETAFVASEGGGVVISTPVDDFGRVINVEHFVENDIFHDEFRDGRGIKRFTDDDSFVSCVVVAQNSVGLSDRPS